MRLVQGDPERGHRAVLAVHRNGGVTVGLSADEGTAELDIRGTPQRVYILFAMVGAVRLALLAQEQVLIVLDRRGVASAGPWELSVALPGASGTTLGGSAEGWDDVRHAFHRPTCTDPAPLIHDQLSALPSGKDARRAALTRVAGRTVNAFGTYSPLYVPTGDDSGLVPDTY
jgi:hypothetical protein